MSIDLRCGDWRTVLSDIEMVDCLITDPPYSARTDKGYRSATDVQTERKLRSSKLRNGCKVDGGLMPKARLELEYKPIDLAWVEQACEFFAPRVSAWFVIFGDHQSARWWEDTLAAHGLVTFAPVPWVRTDAAPRFAGDGPANACEWITIARPKGMPAQRGSRPGWYEGTCQGDKIVTGGKPAWLMQALVRDYSRPGDLICDPCSGGASTLIAAAIEGRRAVGAELDPKTYAKAQARIAKGYTVNMWATHEAQATQLPLIGGEK